MNLLEDIKRKRIKKIIIIVALVVISVIIAIFIIVHINRNRENDIINNYIIGANKNVIITINNDMSKIKLYQKTLKNIKENNKRIQISNNEAKFLLDSNFLQENNKVNPKVSTTNKYSQLNNVVCIEIDLTPVRNRQIIDKINVDISKLNLNTEYVDIYSVNNKDEFSAIKLKEPIINGEIQIDADVSIDRYIIAYVPVIDLTLNYNEIILKKGEEVILKCDMNENATNSLLHAKVTDENIIEVSSNGTIKAINAGKTQLIIQSYKNSVLKTMDVIVKEIPSEIKVNKENIEIEEGETYKPLITVLPENLENKKVKFTSSNERIAKVDKKGNIIGISKGEATITIVTEETPSVSKTIKVKVKKKKVIEENNTEDNIVEDNWGDNNINQTEENNIINNEIENNILINGINSPGA